MTAYAIGYLHQVKDPETFEAYRAVAGDALAKHGGKVAQVLPKPTRLEGHLEAPQGLVLLKFPDWEAANNWHSDAELTETHALRVKGAEISIFVAADAVA